MAGLSSTGLCKSEYDWKLNWDQPLRPMSHVLTYLLNSELESLLTKPEATATVALRR